MDGFRRFAHKRLSILLDSRAGHDEARSSNVGSGPSCFVRVMAYDSGNLDGWESRQAEESSTSACYRNDAGASAIRRHVTREFQDQEKNRAGDLLVDEYSHFRPRTRFSRSGEDARCNETSAPRSMIETANCGDCEALNGHLSSLSIRPESFQPDERRCNGRSTYRCEPSVSSVTPSTLLSLPSKGNSKSSVRVVSCTIGKSDEPEEADDDLVEQPEVHRYDLNGTRVIEISASSSNLSDHGGSTSRSSRAKLKAYAEWMEKKRAAELTRKREIRRIEEKKEAEEERVAREREERERRERENFLQWSERKRKEEAGRRESAERELELERRLKEVEDKACLAKTIYLRQWARKKEEQQKALQRKEELRRKRDDEERKKRLEESDRAYVKWRETSKNRPRPATQGLLPQHKAKPSYVNPNPWVTDDLETTREPTPSGEAKKSISETKSHGKKSVISKQ